MIWTHYGFRVLMRVARSIGRVPIPSGHNLSRLTSPGAADLWRSCIGIGFTRGVKDRELRLPVYGIYMLNEI